MPNRILKESICTSDSIDSLSWFEEVLFYRLIVNCDDYGRFDGRISVIKNRLFPLKDNVTNQTIKTAIEKLASVELVTLYVFEGKPYLHLPSWGSHQMIRAKKSKYPTPCGNNLKSFDFKCNQGKSNVPVIQSNTIYDTREYENTKHDNTDLDTTTTTSPLSQARMREEEPRDFEILEYFQNRVFGERAEKEAYRFKVYNESLKWSCLPNWKVAADRWIDNIKN